MGNFSINHYARFEAQPAQLKLRYILDFAEIPTADQMAKLDQNGDGQVSAREENRLPSNGSADLSERPQAPNWRAKKPF